MNRLFFSPHGPLFGDLDKIFYSQFRESIYYYNIVGLLKSGLWSLDQISKKIHLSSGGGLRRYLENLEKADIIRSFIPVDKPKNSKSRKYLLSDESLAFYFKYVEPNKRIIQESDASMLFETITAKSLDIWLGFAFERFCIKHAAIIAKKMGFGDKVLLASPYFERKSDSFQIDLVYVRSDFVWTICEIKYQREPVSTAVIPDVRRKINLLTPPRGCSIELALISMYGPDKALRNSHFFDYFVTSDDLLKLGSPHETEYKAR